MADAERLMNLMERFDYKSEQYNVCRQALLSHLAKKPTHDDEVPTWAMTGPAPFEFDDLAPPPPFAVPEAAAAPAMALAGAAEDAVTPEPAPFAKEKKRSTRTKKASVSIEKEPKQALTDKPKRVRKKPASGKVLPSDRPAA
jgi:hypothetical protein